ncbi:M56 family metallopeptidase [Mucilaginibacter sp. HD30]
MNTFAQSAETIIQALSRMLFHSVWQGALLALIAGVIIITTKRTSAVIRYNLMLCLFAMFLLITAGTFVYVLGDSPEPAISQNAISSYCSASASAIINLSNTDNSFYDFKTFTNIASSYFNQHYILIVSIWFFLFLLKSLYVAGNMVYLQRVRHFNVFTPSPVWQDKLTSLCEKLQIRKTVLLLESGYLKVPVVIGYFKPVILIPVGMLAGIPAAQVEAVLLHELAHIKRSDYVVNLLQYFAEAVFFFNPGLLWISHLLREERENCCDDMAIAQTNSKEDFVKALISFKEHSVNYPVGALAFSGRKSSLLNRVIRIVYQENKTFSVKESSVFLAAVAMISLMAFTFYPVRNISSQKKTPSNGIASNNIKLAITANKPRELSLVQPLTIKAIDIKKKALLNTTPVKSSLLADSAATRESNIPDNTNSAENTQALIAKAGLSNDKFYSRVSLGNGEDVMQVLTAGSKMMATLPHNAKVAFIVDGVLHDEAELYTFDAAAANYAGKRKGISGSKYNAEKLFPDLDLSKYDAFIAFGMKGPLGSDSP